MKKVKITVLKKILYTEIAEKYLTEGKKIKSCSLLNEGDTFIYTGGAQMPDAFCPWAWIDTYSGVNALSAGGSYKPWNNKDGIQVLCCTDGTRPVVFLLEAFES